MKTAFILALGFIVCSAAQAADFCGTRSKTEFFNTFAYNYRHHSSANPENAIISVTQVPAFPGAENVVKKELNDEMDSAIKSADSAQKVKSFLDAISFKVGTTITATVVNGGMSLQTQGQAAKTIQDPNVFAQFIGLIEKVIQDKSQNDGGAVSCNGFPIK